MYSSAVNNASPVEIQILHFKSDHTHCCSWLCTQILLLVHRNMLSGRWVNIYNSDNDPVVLKDV